MDASITTGKTRERCVYNNVDYNVLNLGTVFPHDLQYWTASVDG